VKGPSAGGSFSTGVAEGHSSAAHREQRRYVREHAAEPVLALDARSGELLWRYKRELPDDLFQLQPNQPRRGPCTKTRSIWLRSSARCRARRQDGKVVWDQTVEDYKMATT